MLNEDDPFFPAKGKYLKPGSKEPVYISHLKSVDIKHILTYHSLSGHKEQELQRELERRNKIRAAEQRKWMATQPHHKRARDDNNATIVILKDEIKGLNEEIDILENLLDSVETNILEFCKTKNYNKLQKALFLLRSEKDLT